MNELKYLNTKQTIETYPFTKGQLEYFLLHRHKNGLESACIKIGKRIYFIRHKLDAWIENGGANK